MHLQQGRPYKADLQLKEKAWELVLTGVSSISVLPGFVMTHWT